MPKTSKAKRPQKLPSVVSKNRPAKLKRKDFEKRLAKLQAELVKLQLWVQHKGLKVVVIFEGRDAAGKGGVIKRITERVSPRVFRLVALPAPTEREKSQMYIQRYVPHLPSAGEIVIFDRSWYNRAGVERIMGFCPEKEAVRFLEMCPEFERAVIQSGVILIKYWFEVSQQEQTGGSSLVSTMDGKSGNSARWILSRTGDGTTIPGRETICCLQPTPHLPPGISLMPTTRSALD